MEQKISIILPCYNQSQYLSEAIESCINQSITPHEIIVVNDGSTDDWEEAVFPYLDDVDVISQTNKGLSSARNAGIKASTGDYVVCLDADDTLPPSYCETLAKIALQDNKDIVGCGYKTFGEYNIEWKTRGDVYLEDLLDGNKSHCSALIKRSVFDKIQYDETMKVWEDWLLYMEAVAHGFKMTCTDKTWLNYRKHGDSMISTAPKYAEEAKEYMEKKVLGIIKSQS